MPDVISTLKRVGAIITDSHFVYTSGQHGSVYINKDALYPHTKETSEIGKLFAEKYQNNDIDVVVGPAYGGIILSQWTAYHLTQLKEKDILGVYSQKTDQGDQVFKRGYDRVVNGKNILVVEDIVNTGESVKKVIEAVKQAGGRVEAVGVMVNRRPKVINSGIIGVPFLSLADFEAESWLSADCPLCKKNIPINTSVGHGVNKTS